MHSRGVVLLVAIGAVLALAAIALAAGTPNSWTGTGAMSTARGAPATATLPGGRVLEAGGQTNPSSAPTATAEVYDPGTGTWSGVSVMNVARGSATAVSLQNGKTLVVAGSTPGTTSDDTAEVYDPVANAWTPAVNTMSVMRGSFPAATLLNDGRVLVVGGVVASPNADVYTPSSNSFTPATPMGTPRQDPSAIRLPSGKVLVVGGSDGTNVLASAEVYDPAANSWTPVANGMSSPRAFPSMSSLPSGKVLIAGGISSVSGSSLGVTASADIYDPATNSFTGAASMHTARVLDGQSILANGHVLVAGGATASGSGSAVLSSAEIYDPSSNTWSVTADLNEARAAQGQTLLSSGQVLDAGGVGSTGGSSSNLASAELFTPSSAPSAPQGVSASAGNGQALVTWAPPASDGGDVVQHYTVTASTGQTVATPDTRTFATVPGLANGRPVTFTVTATNAAGTGGASAPSNSVTPTGPPKPPPHPSVSVSGVPKKLSLKSFLRGVSVKLTPNESVALDASLLAFAKRATITRVYNLTLAEKTLGISGAKRTVKLVPSRKLVGKATKFKALLRVLATDASGNRVTVTKTIQVTPPKKKKSHKHK
jgi:N-acetylneuraminic acid mutarotase